MAEFEKDADVTEINVDDVLGELRDILRQKYTDVTDDEDTSSLSFGADDTGTSVSASSTPQKSPAHSTISNSSVSSVQGKYNIDENSDSGDFVLEKINNADAENCEALTKDSESEDSEFFSKIRDVPCKLDLSISHSSDQTNSPTSPRSETLSPLLAQPIIFKSSIKKDPGSKLHDQLVKELTTVLKKRNNVERTPSEEEHTKSVHLGGIHDKNQNGGKPTKTVFANKALLANLENHLSQTLKNRMEKQRQSLHDYEKASESVPKLPPSETPFENHLSQMLLKRIEKQSETKPKFESQLSATLKTRLEKQRQSIQDYEETSAKQTKSPSSECVSVVSVPSGSKHSEDLDVETKSVTERLSIFQNADKVKWNRLSFTSSTSSHDNESVINFDGDEHVTVSNNDNEKKITIYNVRPIDGVLYSVQVQSSSEKLGEATGNHVTYINISGKFS